MDDYKNEILEEANKLVEEKEAEYQATIESTDAESDKEFEELSNYASTTVSDAKQAVQSVQTQIDTTEQGITDTMQTADKTAEDFTESVDTTYDQMDVADDYMLAWGDNHTVVENTEVGNGGLYEFEETQIDLTAVCDKAKEDYTTLKTAVEQYGKDYNEEAYQQAIASITIPKINLTETNQASEKLIATLEKYDGTAEWIASIRVYQQKVAELHELDFAKTFTDLMATKASYDELKSLREEAKAKELELEDAYNHLDEMFEDFAQHEGQRAEEVAKAKEAFDKAVKVQQDTLAEIYVKQEDPAYENYNKAIDAYYKSLEVDHIITDNKQDSVIEKEKPQTVPAKNENVTKQPVALIKQDTVPTATMTGDTGYALTAVVTLTMLCACAWRKFRKYFA